MSGMEPWCWLIGGVLLAAAEAFAPGVFLIWLGVAAVVTGLITFATPVGFEWSLLLFCVLAVLTVLLGRQFYGAAAAKAAGDRPFLNQRAGALVGRVVILHEGILMGEGRARVDDSVWRVVGPDLPAGAQVRVVGIKDASLLVVEPYEASMHNR